MNKTLKTVILAIAAIGALWLVADTYLSVTAGSRETNKQRDKVEEALEKISE